MRLGKTTLLHFGSQVVVSLAGFAVTFIITNQIGFDALGTYKVLVGIGFFWLGIPAMGVAEGIRKRMSEGTEPGAYFGGGLLLNAVVALLLLGVVFGGSALLRVLTIDDGSAFSALVLGYELELAGLVVATVAFRTVLLGLEGQKRVARTGGLKAVERVVRGVALVALVLAGFGVGTLLVGHAASLAAIAVLGLAVAAVKPERPRLDHLRSISAYARYAWMSALRGRVYGWMDTLVLSLFLSGTTLIGIYEAAWGIASLLGAVAVSVRRTLFPEISDLAANDDIDRIKHFLDEGLVFSGAFVIPGVFGAAVIGQRIMQFYRADASRGGGILVILALAYVADVYASQFISVINGIDAPDEAFRINIRFVALNVVMNVILVWTIGWVGAAIATALSATVRGAMGYRTLSRLVGRLQIPFGQIGREVVASVVMVAVLIPAAGAAPLGRIWTLTLVGLGALVYFVVLLGISARIRAKAQSLAGPLKS